MNNYLKIKVFGPGSNYLSNEIFYRVARLREKHDSSLPPGHLHIKQLQGFKQDFSDSNTQSLIDDVKTIINNGVTGI